MSRPGLYDDRDTGALFPPRNSMASTPPQVCVAGSATVDLTFRTARRPRAGETRAGRAFHVGHGGKGANQAVMARRLGATVTLIGRVGRDFFGESIIRSLGQEGIDSRHVSVDDGRATGTAA